MTVGPVLDFNPVRSGPFDSGPAFSDSDVRSFVFRSYIFQSCTFQPGRLVRHFPVLRFQSPRSGLCRFRLLVPVIVISLPRGRSVVPAMSSRGGSRSHKRCTHTHFSLSRLVRTCLTLVAAGSGFMQDRRTSVNIASIVMTAVIVWDKNGFCSVIFFCILFFFQLFIIIVIYSHKIKTCRTQRLPFK